MNTKEHAAAQNGESARPPAVDCAALSSAPAAAHYCFRCREVLGEDEVDGCRDPNCPEVK